MSSLAAPSIVRATSLMPVKALLRPDGIVYEWKRVELLGEPDMANLAWYARTFNTQGPNMEFCGQLLMERPDVSSVAFKTW
jgi:hypothetical protein